MTSDDNDTCWWSGCGEDPDDSVLVVWPNKRVTHSDKNAILEFIETELRVKRPRIVGCVKHEHSLKVDFLFFVPFADLPAFSLVRSDHDIFFWEEVYFQGREKFYSKELQRAFPENYERMLGFGY